MQYENARASTLTGSVPLKMAEGCQRVSAPCCSRTRVALPQFALTTEPWDCNIIVSIYRKKTVYDSSHLATLNRFFACRIVVLWLLKLNIKRYTRILDCKPFIDTCYRIEHRLELKYFHFAQFLLNAHLAAQLAGHQTQKSENWELEI